MTRRRLCISSFQDWTRAALNRSIQGLIGNVGIESVSTERLLQQLKATLQLSQSVATAWSDGATLHCAIAYNILLHQRDQALQGVSPLVSQEERDRLRMVPFGASSQFDELATKLQLRDKVASRQRDYALTHSGDRHRLPSIKHVLLHIGQHRLDPRLDDRLLYHCRSHVSSPFWPPEDVVQDVPFTNEEDNGTGHDYLCPRTQTPVSPIVMRPLNLYPLDIPQQVVVLPPLLTRKVGA